MSSHVVTSTSGYAKIVVPLDGSSLSEAALPVASALARASHGRLYVARVHAPLIVATDIGFPLAQWEDEIRESEETYLLAVTRTLPTAGELEVETRVLDGPVGRSIRELVEKVTADLVVITTHGRTGLSRAWLGSTADWLVRFTPVPVLLIRPPDEPAAPEISLKHVLVALDGSDRAERVIPEAVRLARLVGARITLVQVVQPIMRSVATYGAPALSQVQDEERTAELMRRAKDYLDGIAQPLRREHAELEVSTRVVASDRTADAILEQARSGGAEVIALSTRGRGASRLLVGSVADKVLRGFTGAMFALGPVAARELESDELVTEAESTAGWR